MRSLTRSLSGLAATVALMAGLTGLAPTAQASIPEPYTSPGITPVWVGSIAASTECASGYLCAFVPGNANPGGWWEFKFYNCGVYNLSYWHDPYPGGSSFVVDDQTGGVTTSYYSGSNGTGSVLQTMTPQYRAFQDVLPHGGGWNPVYSIRVC